MGMTFPRLEHHFARAVDPSASSNAKVVEAGREWVRLAGQSGERGGHGLQVSFDVVVVAGPVLSVCPA